MKKVLSALLALLMLLSLCACGNSKSYASTDEAATDYYYYDDYAYAAEDGSYNGLAAVYDYDEAYAEEAYVEESAGGTQSSASQTEADFSSEKIIYTAYADVETLEFEETCAEVEKLITDCGGFLESSTVYGRDWDSDNRRSADYTIRIPRNLFEKITDNLSTLGNVSYLSVSADNISSEYYDQESRLSTYRVEEERLLSMLESAETVTDMLEIEDRLASVRYNIESLTTTLNNWDSLINYSTLHLSIQEVKEYTEDPEPELSYWEQIREGFVNCLKGIGNFFADLFRIIITLLPLLVLLAVLAGIVLWIIRARRKKHPKKPKADKKSKADAAATEAPAETPDYFTPDK